MKKKMTDPDLCWVLERVGVHENDFILNNSMDTIKIGRKATLNDKVCRGPHVSKQHLTLIKEGYIDDWMNIRWSVVRTGITYINTQKIENNQPQSLNPGDIIGLGCPRAGGDIIVCINISEGQNVLYSRHTFVYRLKAPKVLSIPVVLKPAMRHDYLINRSLFGASPAKFAKFTAPDENDSHTWSISNFTEKMKMKSGDELYSEVFTIKTKDRTTNWFMKLYPNGVVGSCEGFLSLFLYSYCNQQVPITKFTFSIIDKDGNKFFTKQGKYQTENFFKNFLSHSRLQLPNHHDSPINLLPKDQVTILCEINIPEDSIIHTNSRVSL